MASSQAQPSIDPVINLDGDDDGDLTSVHTGDTPTLPSDEGPTIKALDDVATEAEYQFCLGKIPWVTQLAGAKRRRSKSPSEFERLTNMALLYGEDAEEDQLEAWIRQKPFVLDRQDTS